MDPANSDDNESSELDATTESTESAAESSQLAAGDSQLSATAETPDDPLDLFNWQLKHRATTEFARGPYEVRLIFGSDVWILSGDSIESLMTKMRDKAAEVVKKLES